jgi:hypothetical protein
MSEAKRANYLSRDAIMNLMSNDEIAKVSSVEASTGLKTGDEYVDLENLDKGIQRASVAASVNLKHAVPRGAVSSETWSRIMAELATRP